MLGVLEVGTYSIYSIFVGLHNRLKKDDLLDHEVRGRIYQVIVTFPGIHFRKIKKEYGRDSVSIIHLGCLTYHLEVLQKNGMIKSENDGYRKRFYCRGQTTLKSFPEQILESIRNHHMKYRKGLTVKELSAEFDVSPRVMRYNLDKVSHQVKETNDGNGKRYVPIQ